MAFCVGLTDSLSLFFWGGGSQGLGSRDRAVVRAPTNEAESCCH